MPDIKVDIFGSTLTRGVTSNRHDRGRRRAMVTDLTNNNLSLGEAINEAYVAALNTSIDPAWTGSVVPGGHQSVGNMAVSRIRATKFGLNKAWVDLIYQREFFDNTIDPFTIASWDLTSDRMQVYRRWTDENEVFKTTPEGLPDGLIEATSYTVSAEEKRKGKIPQIKDPNREPPGYIWERPVFRVVVAVRLGIHPGPTLASPGTNVINSDEVVWFNWVVSPRVIRFDGARIRHSVDTFGSFFDVNYYFTFAAGGHVKQDVDFNGLREDANGQLPDETQNYQYPGLVKNEWVTTIAPLYPEIPFANHFQA